MDLKPRPVVSERVALLPLLLLLIAVGPADAQPMQQTANEPLYGERPFSTPNPDPTRLTTAQLDAAIKALRELMEGRLDAIDKATDIRLRAVDELPHQVQERIDNLGRLVDERFKRVDTSFDNVSKQFEARDVAVKSALDTTQSSADRALTATKEAVNIANSGVKELISQNNNLLLEVTGSLRRDVDDLKAFTGKLQGASAGQAESSTALGNNIGMIVGVIGAGAAIFALVMRKQEHPMQSQLIDRYPPNGRKDL